MRLYGVAPPPGPTRVDNVHSTPVSHEIFLSIYRSEKKVGESRVEC